MMNKIKDILTASLVGLMLLGVNSVSYSDQLTPLSDTDLAQVNGQAGVDLNLKLSLNHTADYKFDSSVCSSSQLEYCRLAIALNNRYDDGSNDTYSNGVRVPSATGKNQWLVFKGIQGTVLIDKLSLDGADVTFKSKSGTDTYRGALNFGFDPNQTIKIRNFGFQSLSIETDTAVASSSSNQEGFLSTTKYNQTTDNAFDKYNPDTGVAREKGFLGVSMNGNLSLGGSIKVFSCIDHSRC